MGKIVKKITGQRPRNFRKEVSRYESRLYRHRQYGGALAHAAAQSPAPAELLLSNRTPEKAQALAQQLGATVSTMRPSPEPATTSFWGSSPR